MLTELGFVVLAGIKFGALYALAALGLVVVHKATKTVNFEKRENDGWVTECFRPTWFTFDSVPTERPRGASRMGADGPAVLAELGYSPADIKRLVESGAIGRTEWAKG